MFLPLNTMAQSDPVIGISGCGLDNLRMIADAVAPPNADVTPKRGNVFIARERFRPVTEIHEEEPVADFRSTILTGAIRRLGSIRRAA